MNLASLDAALQRIQTIERQFQSLASFGVQADNDFQKILDSKVEHKQDNTSVSKTEINELIDKYSYKNGLDADFVKAVINQESGFNPNATSHCGAMGLMQLMSSTA